MRAADPNKWTTPQICLLCQKPQERHRLNHCDRSIRTKRQIPILFTFQQALPHVMRSHIMLDTLDGIVTDVSPLRPSNADLPMLFTVYQLKLEGIDKLPELGYAFSMLANSPLTEYSQVTPSIVISSAEALCNVNAPISATHHAIISLCFIVTFPSQRILRGKIGRLFSEASGKSGSPCSSPRLTDRLRRELSPCNRWNRHTSNRRDAHGPPPQRT